MATERYLVGDSQRDPGFLATVADAVRGQPDIQLLEEQGDPGSPTLLVASMSPDRADALRLQYAPRLIVEPDGHLKMS